MHILDIAYKYHAQALRNHDDINGLTFDQAGLASYFRFAHYASLNGFNIYLFNYGLGTHSFACEIIKRAGMKEISILLEEYISIYKKYNDLSAYDFSINPKLEQFLTKIKKDGKPGKRKPFKFGFFLHDDALDNMINDADADRIIEILDIWYFQNLDALHDSLTNYCKKHNIISKGA